MKQTRNEFLKTLTLASAGLAGSNVYASAARANSDDSIPIPAKQTSQGADNIKLGVSLYSYQHAIYTGDMTTEDCLAELNSIGAKGVQLINMVTIPNYPNPPESWIEKWFEWMEKYKLTPTLLDTFVDYNWGGRRPLMTTKEAVDTLVGQLKLAKKMGFSVVRPSSKPIGTPWPELWEGIVPYAEELNMKVAPEIHSIIPLKGVFVDTVMGIIAKTGTKHLGLVIDMSSLQSKAYYPLLRETSRISGQFTEEIAEYIEKAKENGEARDKVLAKVNKMNPLEGDKHYLDMVYSYTILNDPKDLKSLMPYIFNIHGKFTKMTDGCVEVSLNYEETFKVLIEGGYNGYIDSEYEGQRHLQNQWAVPINEIEEVRRHHIMMRRLLGRA
jgi:sugar phosphate isomerase/epimerase